jgi:hypothetical protein
MTERFSLRYLKEKKKKTILKLTEPGYTAVEAWIQSSIDGVGNKKRIREKERTPHKQKEDPWRLNIYSRLYHIVESKYAVCISIYL